MGIDWRRIDEETPEPRRAVLLCSNWTQETQVGWWNGLHFSRWREGKAESVRFGPTHWAYIDFPPCSDPISSWDRGILRNAINDARTRASVVGSMHSLWDVISDAEAFLAGKPTLINYGDDQGAVIRRLIADLNSTPASPRPCSPG